MDDPSNEELGRLYLWSAVIDSAALANVEEPAVPKYCGYLSGEVCTFDKPVQGVCPDGWHVPSKAEGNQITTQFSNVNTTKLMEFNVTTKAMEEVSVSYSTSGLWTSDDYNNEYSYRTYNGTNGSNVPKKVALPVRCIKNAAEEVTP